MTSSYSVSCVIITLSMHLSPAAAMDPMSKDTSSLPWLPRCLDARESKVKTKKILKERFLTQSFLILYYNMLIEYQFKCLELGEKNLFREVKILRCDASSLMIQILHGGDDDDHDDAHLDVHDELFH